MKTYQSRESATFPTHFVRKEVRHPKTVLNSTDKRSVLQVKKGRKEFSHSFDSFPVVVYEMHSQVV